MHSQRLVPLLLLWVWIKYAECFIILELTSLTSGCRGMIYIGLKKFPKAIRSFFTTRPKQEQTLKQNWYYMKQSPAHLSGQHYKQNKIIQDTMHVNNTTNIASYSYKSSISTAPPARLQNNQLNC
jgi:hypothetical protein